MTDVLITSSDSDKMFGELKIGDFCMFCGEIYVKVTDTYYAGQMNAVCIQARKSRCIG